MKDEQYIRERVSNNEIRILKKNFSVIFITPNADIHVSSVFEQRLNFNLFISNLSYQEIATIKNMENHYEVIFTQSDLEINMDNRVANIYFSYNRVQPRISAETYIRA